MAHQYQHSVDETPPTASLHPRPTFEHRRTDSGWSDHGGRATPPVGGQYRDQPSPQPSHREYAGSAAMYGSGGLSTPGYLGGQTPYQSHDDLNRYTSQANLNSYQSTDALGAYSGGAAAASTGGAYGSGKPAWANVAADRAKAKKRKMRILLFVLLGVVVLAIIIALVVYFAVVKKKDDDTKASDGNGGKNNGTTPSAGKVLIGKNGDTVTMEDGTNFTYTNNFGGYFVVDESNPYNYDSRAQEWTPPLNESWPFGKQRIFGVNLGGWLVPEPFIVPHLYEKYMDTVPGLNGDEYTLSEAMAADTANGGLNQMEEHYKTFITEQDFAEIAGAGLNWIRLPIPFNAFGTVEGEPFLANVAWTYVLKAFAWSRKYGIRICLDFHTMPGSHNGLNHSGKRGFVAWMGSVMGLANAQRSLNFIRGVTRFISQPEYANLVPILGLVNEPQGQDWTTEPKVMHSFYLHAYREIRKITGIGAGKGPYIAIHDHFESLDAWETFMHGADRLALDSHMYFTFGGQDQPSIEGFPAAPCGNWGRQFNRSQNNFGLTFGGEWSLGFNDCGQHVWNLGQAPNTKACEQWNDYPKYTDAVKTQLRDFALSHMDAFGNFFFWTWKTTVSKFSPGGTLVGAPFWNYQLGLQNGWMPTDPRDSIGHCAGKMGVTQTPEQQYVGELQSWMTGGTGAGEIAPTVTQAYDVWPPPALATISNLPVPTYTATGPVPMLPTPTFAAGVNASADGWANDADTDPGMVPIANCKYPDPWNPGGSPPNPLCQ